MRALGERPGVTVTGSVPDVRPFVRASAAMVAPLAIARGTQNKILEAMAMGVPVVTSRIAAGGVDAEPERSLAGCRLRRGAGRGDPALLESPGERAAAGARPAGSACSAITPGPSR